MADSAFGFERPEDSLGFLLWQTTVTWQCEIKKVLDEHDVSHVQFVVMANAQWFEEKGQNPTQALIARQSKTDKMTVSKSVRSLVAEGFIKRAEHEDDARAHSVRLTTKGKKKIMTLVPLMEAVDEKFFAALSPGNQRVLGGFFMKLVGAGQ